MPTASPTVAVRLRHAHVRHAAETDRIDAVASSEAERWAMFGQVVDQHAGPAEIVTTIQPRGPGGALALHRAIEASVRHVLVEGATT